MPVLAFSTVMRLLARSSIVTMIFSVPHLVSYLSRFMLLEAGDVITTGTPPGVGMGLKPKPRFLKGGETVRLGIEGLGEQTQKVVKFKKKK